MKQRPRIYYTESQKALMWERWRAGTVSLGGTRAGKRRLLHCDNYSVAGPLSVPPVVRGGSVAVSRSQSP